MSNLALLPSQPQATPAEPAFDPAAPVLIAVDINDDARRPPKHNLLVLEDFQAGLPVFSVAGEKRPIILHAPPMLLSAVLTSLPTSPLVRKLLAWLETVGAWRVPLLDWRRGTEVAALRQITEELGRQARLGMQRQRQVAAEVTRMRAINAELQHHFLVAESSLLRSGAMPLDIAFSNEPMTEPVHVMSLSDVEAGAAQILPVQSNGVSAVGIHLAQTSETVSGSLVAQLTSLEDGRLIERWSIRATDLVPGWNVLALSRAISGQSRTLELRLSRLAPDDRLPPISLGSGQPILSFQIRDVASGTPMLRNSMALQVWRGLPGAVLPGWFKAHQPRRNKGRQAGYVDIPLPPADLTQVEHANPEQVSFDFPGVVGPLGERAILCHAPVHGVTLARLPTLVPQGAIRFAASAFIDNQQSRDVDFALILAADTAQALALAEGTATPEPHEAFSGWTQVHNRQVRRLSAFREDSSGDALFFVATRMTRQGENSFARSRFKDLSVMVQA
ncbi:MAG: DUF6212 domain-containing protein [Candidatus Devosia phytovorans]|uniref:DUF6212 domain-containing protein n=1 Tax=Candidatus Devosia phytovorans TaxID=3121372 RepID=A0AAJ6AYJ0_9HYPH|nr:DUF6212 domain-containing protein [Devosia sp.]WEK03635.1 MAG: DUF6212 domain-containing protein [Devosia sp.]